MNPDFFEEPEDPPAPSRWRKWPHVARRAARRLALIAFYRPFSSKRQGPQPPWLYRAAAGVLYRLGIGTLLLVLAVVVLLTAATHPRAAIAESDPGNQGLYYTPVSFLSLDGVRLDAWLIPALDAQRVLQNRDEALLARQPAVILVHNYGRSRIDMLPLIRPLHDAGFLIMAVNLRGCGPSGSAPQTFGLHEWMDVKAAVDLLRRRPFVDPNRIAAIGIGSGANAIELACKNGADLQRVVLENPLTSFDQAVNQYILPPPLQYNILRTLFRWTFSALYRTDISQLNESPGFQTSQAGKNAMTLRHGLPDDPQTIARVCAFLQGGT